MNLSKYSTEPGFSLKSGADRKCIEEVSHHGLDFEAIAIGQRSSDDNIGLTRVTREPDVEYGKQECEESRGFIAGQLPKLTGQGITEPEFMNGTLATWLGRT